MDSVLHYRVDFFFSLTPFLVFFIFTRLSIFTIVLLLFFCTFIPPFCSSYSLISCIMYCLSVFASSSLSVNNLEYIRKLTISKFVF